MERQLPLVSVAFGVGLRQLHGVHTLNGKPVVVVTNEGAAVSLGRFILTSDPLHENADRLELEFATEEITCRLRINSAKIPEIKKTWDGSLYRYVLPAGNAVWAKSSTERSGA